VELFCFYCYEKNEDKMNTFFQSVINWIKANMLLAIGIGVGVLLFLFRKKIFHTRRLVHHRRLPRSVGTRRRRKVYTKGGKAKKPWQIKGSEAARRHMAHIRRMR
jgi:hypothetical protein